MSVHVILERSLSRGLALAAARGGSDGDLGRLALSVRALATGPFLGGACDLAPCRAYRERLEAMLARFGQALERARGAAEHEGPLASGESPRSARRS